MFCAVFGCTNLGLKNPTCVKEMTVMRYDQDGLNSWVRCSSGNVFMIIPVDDGDTAENKNNNDDDNGIALWPVTNYCWI